SHYIAQVAGALAAVASAQMSRTQESAQGKAADTAALAAPWAQRLADEESRSDGELGTSALSEQLVAALSARDGPTADTLAQSGHLKAYALGHELLTRIGNQSNLILDPDLDSYYTMSLVVLRFPDLLEAMTRLATPCDGASVPEQPLSWCENRFIAVQGRFDTIVTGIRSDFSEAVAAASPEVAARLRQDGARLLASLDAFRSDSERAAGITGGTLLRDVFTENALESVKTLSSIWSSATAELDRMLQARIEREYGRMWLHLGTAALFLLVILSIVYFVARQISSPIKMLAAVADDVSKSGNYTLRASWSNRDEIGRLVDGFNNMLERLNMQRMQEQELEAQRRAAHAQQVLLDSVPLALVVTSIPDHRILHSNEAAKMWMNSSGADPWAAGMDRDARARFFQMLSDTGKVDEFEVRWNAMDRPTWSLVSARRIEYQGTMAVLTTFTPISRLKALEERMELSSKVLASSSEGVAILNPRFEITFANPAFCNAVHYERLELIGKPMTALVGGMEDEQEHHPLTSDAIRAGRPWQGEVRIVRKDKQSYSAWLVIDSLWNAQRELSHVIATTIDITRLKEAEQRIQYMAHHDPLTDLPNRILFEERLSVSLQQANRSGAKVAVVFIDLDRFKNINDSMGHHVGDGLLRSVAQRLLTATRAGDTVCRLGGDEFVLVLNDVDGPQEVGTIMERRLLPGLCEQHQVEGVSLYVTCSVGIAMYPGDGLSISDLMRNADAAMYKAKHSGRNNFQFFTAELNDQVVQRLHLDSELRRAVLQNEFVLHYQPRVSARRGGAVGFECLVRWEHPEKGLLPPVHFIEAAEESGIIGEIGTWVLREACRQQREWKARGLGEIPLSVNISALQLKDQGFLSILKGALTAHGTTPGSIELELTESTLMDHAEQAIKQLQEIKRLGVLVSVDDFGTGYSSLNYLYRFPLDKIKIDKSFVRNVHTSAQSHAVTKVIIGLGQALGMGVVAEGVECEEERELLAREGCDEFQGYLFSRPMPAAQVPPWLARQDWKTALAAE
ncbi:EAL domain-containing protein, partial [Noviherbaspirillum galbum]